MDIIEIPYIAYHKLNINDFSKFIQEYLLKLKVPKDNWINDIGDNFYYYLENYYKDKGIKYTETFNEELEDFICDNVYKYLNLC